MRHNCRSRPVPLLAQPMLHNDSRVRPGRTAAAPRAQHRTPDPGLSFPPALVHRTLSSPENCFLPLQLYLFFSPARRAHLIFLSVFHPRRPSSTLYVPDKARRPLRLLVVRPALAPSCLPKRTGYYPCASLRSLEKTRKVPTTLKALTCRPRRTCHTRPSRRSTAETRCSPSACREHGGQPSPRGRPFP